MKVGLVDMGCTEGGYEKALSCLYGYERGFCLTTNVSTTLSSKETPKEEPLSPPMNVAQLPKRDVWLIGLPLRALAVMKGRRYCIARSERRRVTRGLF